MPQCDLLRTEAIARGSTMGKKQKQASKPATKETLRGDVSLLTQPQSGSTRYQWVAWKAGYKSAAEYNWHNRRGGD